MDPNPQPDDDASMETDSHSFDDVSMEMHADSTDDISMDFDSDYYNRLSKEAFLVDHICQQLERMMSRLVKKEEVGPFTNDVCLLNKWRRDEFKGRKTFTTRVVLVMLEKVLGRDSNVHSDLTSFVPYNPESKE